MFDSLNESKVFRDKSKIYVIKKKTPPQSIGNSIKTESRNNIKCDKTCLEECEIISAWWKFYGDNSS